MLGWAPCPAWGCQDGHHIRHEDGGMGTLGRALCQAQRHQDEDTGTGTASGTGTLRQALYHAPHVAQGHGEGHGKGQCRHGAPHGTLPGATPSRGHRGAAGSHLEVPVDDVFLVAVVHGRDDLGTGRASAGCHQHPLSPLPLVPCPTPPPLPPVSCPTPIDAAAGGLGGIDPAHVWPPRASHPP